MKCVCVCVCVHAYVCVCVCVYVCVCMCVCERESFVKLGCHDFTVKNGTQAMQNISPTDFESNLSLLVSYCQAVLSQSLCAILYLAFM